MMTPPVMAPKAKDVTAEPMGKPALTIVFSELKRLIQIRHIRMK